MALGALFAILLALPGLAQTPGEANLGCFGGLNDADTGATLPPCDSQSQLNVESNQTGTAVLKRKGFTVVGNLSCSTCPITGSHSFIDSSGNKLDIVCYNRYCAKSTNGNAFTDFLTVAASSATRWSWVDQGGVAYGFNNAYDPPVKYDGTSVTRPAGMPKGSIGELTQDRLVVADIQSNPNRVHRSSAGAFEQFTTGVNPEDSFFDDVGAPGDRVRGLKCLNGVCYIFKTASITACEEDNQYNTRCAPISTNLGTTDPASIVTAGSELYFRAQDKNYWELSRSGLRQISQKIPALVKSQSGGLGGGENTNTQTTQADWQAGNQSPSSTFDTITLPGSIFPSSSTFVDTSSTDFNQGTPSGTGSIPPGSVLIGGLGNSFYTTYNGEAVLENVSPAWSRLNQGANTASSVSNSTLTLACNGGSADQYVRYYLPLTPSTTVNHLVTVRMKTGSQSHYGRGSVGFYNSVGGSFIASVYLTTFSVNMSSGSLTPETNASGALEYSIATAQSFSTYTVLISTYGPFRIWRNGFYKGGGTYSGTWDAIAIDAQQAILSGADPSNEQYYLDVKSLYYASNVADPGNIDIPALSTFTSRIYDTGFSTTVSGPLSISVSTPSGTGIAISVRTSTSPNNDMWTAFESIAISSRPITAINHYWQYRATFTAVNFTTSPALMDVSLPFASTGTFRTQCIQPNSSISAWGSLSCAETKLGNGSLVYYATSAATCAGLPSVAPTDTTKWTQVTNNATLSIATNTAAYVGWRSLLGSATDQAQVDACTLAWNEGTPAQPSWAVYDSVKDAIYWTTTVNNAAYSNRLLKYDRRLETWHPWSISAAAPKIINNTLYFGGASSGTWSQYGGVDADNGQSIPAHWQSKDVGSDSPFQEKEFKSVSLLTRNNQAGTLAVNYTYSNATTGSYSVSLSTGPGIVYARSNVKLPLNSPRNFLNVRVGNNSTTPFEVLGIGIKWMIQPWKVGGP